MRNRFLFFVFVIQLLTFLLLAQESRLQLGAMPESEEMEELSAMPQMPFAATQKTYAENSVLASGKFVKIKITKTGLHKISYDALKSMGVDPANVRVFGYGGGLQSQDLNQSPPDDLPEVAIWMEKGSDGVFNSGDFIVFYARGVRNWHFDSRQNSFRHTLNHYSNEGYYFITSDAGTGKRPAGRGNPMSAPEGSTVKIIREFDDFDVHEVEGFNLGKSGKVFYGEEFNISPLSRDFSFKFSNIVPSQVSVWLDMAVSAGNASRFELSLNGATPSVVNVPIKRHDSYVVGFQVSEKLQFSNASDQLNFTLRFSKTSSEQRAYLNYMALNVRRKLIMTENQLYFRNKDNYGTDAINHFRIENAPAGTQVWDVTDPVNMQVVAITQNGNIVEFYDTAEILREYVAVQPAGAASSFPEPSVSDNVPNQNLHAMEAAEFTIITHPKFLVQAQRLAQAHRDMDNMSVNVITTEQTYNEFSSGTPDASAYRLAMKMWYDRPGPVKPKYLLLFGRGSYDNRGIIKDSGDNLVITYQADNSLDLIKSYVTDDYFGMLREGSGVLMNSDKLDLGIGRFSVSTTQQAEDVVNKMIAYMSNKVRGNWKNQLAFVADDGDGGLHMRDMENQVTKVMEEYFPGYQYNRLHLDAYKKEVTASGSSYPLVENRLNSLLSSGLFMLNFMGHAGEHGWTDERILTTADIVNMYNDKLPLWVAATCDFVLFDVKPISAGEYVLLNPSGGGIGLFSEARVVYASENARLNNKFVQRLFAKESNGEYPRLGDAVRMSKNDVGGSMNKLSYMLFGNPALRLTYPTHYKVVTESLNGNPVAGDEVLRALSVNHFGAYVADEDGNRLTDFNGEVEISIYDKVQRIQTLNNQDGGAITYNDRPNRIYSGKALVKNGEFEFTAMIPRDIRYNFGTGRINYYATEEDEGREAQGYYENFIVGGTADAEFNDSEGPEVSIYLNSPDFMEGGKVNETPLFVAHVSDENGINTAGSGIGHDLKLVIDNNPVTTYILNDNYESDPGSYRSGTVRMKLPELTEGRHTLSFYAWDLLNNSTVQTVEFEVVNGLKPRVFSVSNYPNPAQTHTSFVIEHDRPQTVLETTLTIYDLAGRLLYTKKQSNADNLTWDLRGAGVGRVAPGVYLYKISVNTINGKMTSKANKIIVLTQ